jgi:hypothetical protein
MTRPVGEILSVFEALLARHPLDYDALIGAFRSLRLPANVTSTDLTHLYAICFRLMRIQPAAPPVDLQRDLSESRAAHLFACARDLIENAMFDSAASTRAWIARSRQGFVARGQPIPEGATDDHLPARLDIPWDESTAATRIQPFLEHYEACMGRDPACHFRICWNVMRDGYPVFRQVIGRWMEGLDARHVGTPGTSEAIAKACMLYDQSDDAAAMTWEECERHVLPALDDAHVMVAAGAARYLGALYAQDCLVHDPATPRLVVLLEQMRDRSRNRAAVCGAFICGYDSMCEGLGVLASDQSLAAEGFDLDRWVIDVLAAEQREVYLPNAQAFWFYVHEHYAGDPAFVTRLIDMDRAWIAMMCATDLNEPVENMRPVLERLASERAPEIAVPAQAHLKRHY